ncbi:MAG: Gfo/Idh/MocA family oxidoreductase [Methanothrix sp.]|jgi:predicted dehydrogenase|nr:Gfo/Idh/MocA family oxidoreductase [Methanothrix sp.]
MEKLKVGVIGAGKMGLLHSGIFNSLDNSMLKSVSDKDRFITNAIKSYLPGVAVHQDYEDMINKEDLDIVVITTPVFLHRRMIEDSMNQGLTIFVEKPLALSGLECQSILNKNYNKPTLVGYCRRFMETYNLAKKIIDSEELGKVNYFTSHMYVSQIFRQGKGWLYNPKMSGGGALIDLGSHAIDLFHYLFGDISTIHAFAKTVFNKEVEDYLSANLLFEDRALGSLQVSWSIRNYRLPELKIDIHLENGVITVTEKYITIYSEINDGLIKKGWTTYYKQELKKDVPMNIAGPEYTLEDLHLLDCILNSKKTICDFNEAAKTNFVIDRIYSSIENESIEKMNYEV